MVSRAAADRWKGAVVGILAVGAVFLLGRFAILPAPVMTVAFLFGGGLAAGLFTPGTVRDGAITGAACGALVALLASFGITLASLVNSEPYYPPFWMTFGFYALILTSLLLPYNAIGGAAGTAVRNGVGGGEHAGRGRWFGIGVGTAIIAASALFLFFVGPFVVAAPLAGGFIAGFFAGDKPRDGFAAGLVAALFGTGLFSLPLLWTASYGTGFAAGLAGMAAIALGYIFISFGTAAGVAGAVVRASHGKV
ncbi:MAG TPA: hypothetical protein PLD13_07070 [Methanoculleus sp.]|nr:hypothetical protein [Methanoculleus sp.]